jgi:hypothetical protein
MKRPFDFVGVRHLAMEFPLLGYPHCQWWDGRARPLSILIGSVSARIGRLLLQFPNLEECDLAIDAQFPGFSRLKEAIKEETLERLMDAIRERYPGRKIPRLQLKQVHDFHH